MFLEMEGFYPLALNFGFLTELKALWNCSTVQNKLKKASSYREKKATKQMILPRHLCLKIIIAILLLHVESKQCFLTLELHLPTITTHCSNHLRLLGNEIYPTFHAHYRFIIRIRSRLWRLVIPPTGKEVGGMFPTLPPCHLTHPCHQTESHFHSTRRLYVPRACDAIPILANSFKPHHSMVPNRRE